MLQLMSRNLCFAAGVALMATAIVGGAAAAVILRSAGKRLRRRLEQEFGKKRS